MITAAHIKWSVILLGVVGAFLLLFTVLRGNKQHNDEMFKALLRAKESEIQAIQFHRTSLEKQSQEKDEIITRLLTRDSMLAIQQQQSKRRNESIPVTVRNYNHDELRSAALEFQD